MISAVEFDGVSQSLDLDDLVDPCTTVDQAA